MRLPIASLMLASLVSAMPAEEGSVGSLVAAVRTAIRAGRPDRDIARILDSAKLTEQLEDAVVEQFQSEGAGPETLEGLDRQRELSRNLAKPAQPPMLSDQKHRRRLQRRRSRVS